MRLHVGARVQGGDAGGWNEFVAEMWLFLLDHCVEFNFLEGFIVLEEGGDDDGFYEDVGLLQELYQF